MMLQIDTTGWPPWAAAAEPYAERWGLVLLSVVVVWIVASLLRRLVLLIGKRSISKDKEFEGSNWDLAASPARLRSARVARGRRGAARCEDAACRNAVLACNAADSQLYETYERRFDAEMARRGGDEQFRANRRAVVAAPARNAPPFASKYPINCQQPNTGPPERRRWKLLNSCGGRVD